MSLPRPFATVRILLECIQFGPTQRPLTENITLKLIRTFKTKDCDNLNPFHTIPALATRNIEILSSYMLSSSNTEMDPTTIHRLQLQFLNGQHCVAAAKQFHLNPQCWLVTTGWIPLIHEHHCSYLLQISSIKHKIALSWARLPQKQIFKCDDQRGACHPAWMNLNFLGRSWSHLHGVWICPGEMWSRYQHHLPFLDCDCVLDMVQKNANL